MNANDLSMTPLSVAPELPYHEPDLAIEHKLAIIEALRWGWSELCSRWPELARAGDEESITARLQEILNRREGGHRVATWLKDFETVCRGGKQRTSDNRINKQPDLAFRPPAYDEVSDTTRWGWFVECKIVDGAPSVGVYRDDGVQRFSSGEYAAWMPSGVMLAYVRDGSRPGTALSRVLPGKVGTRRHEPGRFEDQSESEHDRSKIAHPCVDVILTHLWLPCVDTGCSNEMSSDERQPRKRPACDPDNLHPLDAEARQYDDTSEGIDWDEIIATAHDIVRYAPAAFRCGSQGRTPYENEPK